MPVNTENDLFVNWTVIFVHNFALTAWKLKLKLITQTCHQDDG